MTEEKWKSRIVGHDEVDPKSLVANPLNFKDHPDYQKAVMSGVLDEIGWIQTVVVNKITGNLIDGHMRVDIALARNEKLVPVTYVELTEEEEKKALLTFNPVAALARDNQSKLKSILDAVAIQNEDMQSLAKKIATKNKLPFMEDTRKETVNPNNEEVDEEREERINKWGVKTGQLWRLGENMIVCGDCTVQENIKMLLDGNLADAIVTDPPYNIGLGYDEYGDNLPQEEYLDLMYRAFKMMFGVANAKSHLVCTLGHNQIFPVRDEIIKAGWDFRHIGVWANPTRHKGSHPGMWPFGWEAVLDFTKEGFKRLNNGNGVGCSDVWVEAPVKETDHPAERPKDMWKDIVELVSNRGDIVFDPFSGSGQTLMTCEKTGRQCRAIELSPGYVAMTIERWVAFTGEEPVLVEE